jgi:phosphatidylserine/phosphatidylglycerophosphate/cardiolipin synthase-like enzyme
MHNLFRSAAWAVVVLTACLYLSLGADRPASAAARLDAAFSPGGDSLELVLSAIAEAKKSILVAAYSFTSKPIATALLDAHKRGVTVRVVADQKSNQGRYTAVTFLANQGVPTRLNGKYAILHHKFMVIDGRHVQTGSFNYSAAAVDKNAENVLVLRDAPKLARSYIREWRHLWREGIPVSPRY